MINKNQRFGIISIDNIARSTIILLLACTPLFSIFELFSFFQIQIFDAKTMVYFKLPKDILFVVLIFFLSLKLFNKTCSPIKLIGLCLYVFITMLSVLLSMGNVTNFVLLAGIRWSLPFLVFPLLIGITDLAFVKRTTIIIAILISINLTFQIFELLFMPPFFGYNYFGGSGRLPGFFIHPSGCGLFGGLSLYFIRYFWSSSERSKILFQLICVCSIVLSQSTLGFILLAINFILPKIISGKYKFVYIFFAVAFSIFVYLNIDLITGRDKGNSGESIGTRLQIFNEMIDNAESISTHFGNATNTARNVNDILDNSNNSFIADSFYTSVFVNYGVFAFLFIILLLIGIGIIVFVNKNTPKVLLFIIFCLSSISVITTEHFPTNLIFSIAFSYFVYYHDSKSRKYLVKQ